MKTTTLISILMLVTLGAAAQQNKPRQGLTVGDRLPDLEFTEVYNHRADTVRLADYRGKWIILDFWSTLCASCLKAFPKVDSLQREYGDRIQILAVSRSDYQETADFFDSHPNVHLPDVPFITADTVLANLFPHAGNPYHVWISPNGMVVHLEDGRFLTRENLDLALAGKPTGIPITTPFVTYMETLLDTTYDAETAYASYLVHYDGRFRIQKPLTANIFTTEGTIKRLYQHVYRRLGDIGFNPFQAGRIVLVTDNPFRYEFPPGLRGEAYDAWQREHTYFYQGRVPLADSSRLFDWVKADFERYFGLSATVENRLVDSWILVRTDSIDRLATKGGTKQHTFAAAHIHQSSLPSPVRQLRNVGYSSFSAVVTKIVERITGQPCFDNTRYAGKIDVDFRGETLDQPTMANLRRDLRDHGLDLVKVKQQLDVLVLRENDEERLSGQK
jgi:thiol-disulfide isomerase/thioredoxin